MILAMNTPAPAPASPPLVVVYDGACRFCRAQMGWIARRAAAGDFEFVPSQSAELLTRFPQLRGEEFNAGLRLVAADGGVQRGADAVYRIARRLRGWRWVALLYRVPGLTWLARRAYALVAARRYRLAGRCAESCAVAPSEK